MTLEEKIVSDTSAAQKSGEADRLATLRLLVAGIRNKAIEKRGSGISDPLTDAEVMDVIQREAKKRREAIDLYKKGGRADLAAKEEAELVTLGAYLPAQLSRAEVADVVKRLSVDHKDFNALIKAAMAELKGKTDGKLVSELVKETLG